MIIVMRVLPTLEASPPPQKKSAAGCRAPLVQICSLELWLQATALQNYAAKPPFGVWR